MKENPVKNNVMLTVASLLSILFITFHLSDDIVRGFEPGGFKHISGILTLVAWLYGTLVLGERGISLCSSGRSLGRLCPSPT